MSANKVTVNPTTKTVTVSSVGTVGPQGSTGPQGSQGPQGIQGVQGNTGSTGPTGPAGTAATIAIGTVTTLSAGASATVTNSGSSTAATLDFGIPQGATGTGTGSMNDVVDDTSPSLGGNLDVNGKDIVSVSNGDIDLDPNGSGKVVFKGNSTKGSGQFVLNCENNSHGIVIKGPPHSAGASYTLTLPNNDGDSGQFLKTDGSGNLSWSADNNTTYSVQDGELSQNNFTNTLKTKLDNIEATADVTDATNVNSAGAVMHTDIPDTDTGFVKRTGSETYDIDTSTYLTGNQTVTLSGDVTGSGTTGITATLANSGVSAATYGSATQVPVFAVDAKGRVTSVTNTSITSTGIDEGTAIALAIAL